MSTSLDQAAPGSVAEDREWIDRIRSGSTAALETLFRAHVRGLTAFAFRYVQSYDAAARVVDDVFIRLWQGRHSWAFHGSVRGNLFASAHRVALEELRRTRSEARWHAGLPATNHAGEADARAAGANQNDLHAALHDTIARLPAVTRTVGFMRWADRLTRAEIATVLGSNVRTVHTQITPASRAMRKRLAPTSWVIDKRPLQSTLRDAGDNADPFPMIDPDRIEGYLAGEAGSADIATLCQDVATAGGDPAALEAMESAWYGPGRIIADVVDPDAAWSTLADRLSVPHGRREREGQSRAPLPNAVAALARVRAAASEGRRKARAAAVTTASAVSAHAADLKAGPAQQMAARARERLGDVSVAAWSETRRLSAVALSKVRDARWILTSRVARSLAIVVAGVALMAGVWALVSRHVVSATPVERRPPATSPGRALRARPLQTTPPPTAVTPERPAPNTGARHRRLKRRPSPAPAPSP